jgi:hypothetical protein
MTTTGNKHQSEWSQQFHAGRMAPGTVCPVNGGCGGDCRVNHPRGIVVDASGRWRPVPPADPDAYPSIVEHYV